MYFIKKKAVIDTKLEVAKHSLINTSAQRTRHRETLKKSTNKHTRNLPELQTQQTDSRRNTEGDDTPNLPVKQRPPKGLNLHK